MPRGPKNLSVGRVTLERMSDIGVDLPAPESMSRVELESDICTLAGHLAAATCRWLLLLAEFDRREAWAAWGTRSCAHWLSWRCGLGFGTAREHLRVGRALVDLPLLRAEFAAGRLSYSKVRALTRIATPALEAELVALGLGAPAGHVERIVGSYRRALDRERVPAEPRPAMLTRYWAEDGSLVVTVRVGPDDGALLVAGLDAYGALLAADTPTADPTSQPEAAVIPPQPPTPPETNDPDTSLPDAGPAPDACPALVPTPARGPVAEAEAFMAMVAAATATGPTDSSGADRFEVVLHADLDQLSAMTLDAPVDARDETPSAGPVTPTDDPASLRRGRCHLRDGPAIFPETLRRIACEARIRLLTHGPDGSPQDVGRRLRLVTAPLRRLVEERDQGRCRFPSCHRRRRLHAHHVQHWSQGGRTDLDNLILLCPFHHQLVHEHGYTISVRAGGGFSFACPDGTKIDPAPHIVGNAALHCLPAPLHTSPWITSETTTPLWWGEPVHLPEVVDGLLRGRDHAARQRADVPAGTPNVSPGYDPWSRGNHNQTEPARVEEDTQPPPCHGSHRRSHAARYLEATPRMANQGSRNQGRRQVDDQG